MSEELAERVRESIIADLTTSLKRWQRRRPHNAMIDMLLPRERPLPKAIYVFEYSSCNTEVNRCTGDVVRAWVIDQSGAKDMNLTVGDVSKREFDPKGIWYQHSIIQFWIDPLSASVVIGATNGPRAGFGGKFKSKIAFDLDPNTPRWIS